jgi:hypothetical protein
MRLKGLAPTTQTLNALLAVACAHGGGGEVTQALTTMLRLQLPPSRSRALLTTLI